MRQTIDYFKFSFIAFFLLIFLGLDIENICYADEPTLHGEYSLSGALHRTGGSGDKTLLRRGNFLTNELKLESHIPLPGGDWNLDSNIDMRKTPDPQIDKRKDVNMLGWTTELYNPFVRFTGGDFYGDFSQYTLSQSLKGVQVAAKTDTFELKGVAGYSQKQDEGSHFLRYVFGGRSETQVFQEWGIAKDLRAGVNFSDVEDDHSSIENKTGVPDASNRVGSVNNHVMLWDKTEIDSEAAKSWADDDTSPGNVVDRKKGTAVRVNSLTRFSKMSKAKLNYEWVTSQFETLNGSAVPDRVNFNGRWDYKFNQEWGSDYSYRLMYDKLNKSTLNKRTMTQTPKIGLSWDPKAEDWLLKDYSQRVYWEMRNRTSDSDPSGKIDFQSNEYSIENDFAVENVNFDSGYTFRSEDDDQDKSNVNFDHSGYFGMKMREKYQNATATPSLRYQFDYQALPKQEGHDLTQTLTAGLRLDMDNGLSFEQRYSASGAARLADDADSTRFNVYLGLDYKLPRKEDMTLKVSYELIALSHQVSTSRFSENNLQVQLLWKF